MPKNSPFNIINIFLLISIVSITIWSFTNRSNYLLLLHSFDTFINFLIIFVIYLGTQILRLTRISLLLLEQRKKIPNFQLIHIHSAFFSSLIPFKLGELIRLYGFLLANKSRTITFAFWLNERFLDITSITISIILVWLINIEISIQIRNLFTVFMLAVFMSLFFMVAFTNFITFFNRYMIINSVSKRSLRLLRYGNFIENIKEQVISMTDNRILILIFLSLVIWFFEIVSIFTYIKLFSANISISDALAAILLGNFDSENQIDVVPFILFRTVALALMIILFYLLYAIKKYLFKGFKYE